MLVFFQGRSFFPTTTATSMPPHSPTDWWAINYRHGSACSVAA
jgi:hypothetical protein